MFLWIPPASFRYSEIPTGAKFSYLPLQLLKETHCIEEPIFPFHITTITQVHALGIHFSFSGRLAEESEASAVFYVLVGLHWCIENTLFDIWNIPLDTLPCTPMIYATGKPGRRLSNMLLPLP